jgi:hypothetical protein
MTKQLPLSYTQQFATLYILLAGPRPISSQEALGILTPWLSGKLKASQMPSVKSVRVSVVEDPDVGPVIASKPFSEGGKLYQAGSLDNTVVTGIKWNLRHPTSGAVTEDLAAALRSGFRSTGKQSLQLLGFSVLQSTIYPYNSKPSITDYKIPETPELPPIPEEPVIQTPIQQEPTVVEKIRYVVQPKVVVQTKESAGSAALNWTIGALAMIVAAVATQKLAKRNGAENA